MRKITPLIRWWVTPYLPKEDVFAKHNFITQWIVHPIKRRIARIWLKCLRRFGNVKVIGITGSTGKTTTTEILASILSRVGKTVWSKVGVDPVYNIPNTILSAGFNTKYLVLEMSVEYKNEMDYYLWMATPDVGVITNIDSTHLEYLGSLEGVADEKGKMLTAISGKGIAVINKEDRMSSKLVSKISAYIAFFGLGSNNLATNIILNDNLSTEFILKLGKNKKCVHINAYGSQFVSNALAAATIASSLGISFTDIIKGIELFKKPPHRLNVIRSEKYGLIFDDTYNSNPKAANESLDTYLSLAKNKKRYAIIGDMLELGKIEEDAHKKLGKKVGKIGFVCFIGVGKTARFMVEEAAKYLGNENCFLVGSYTEAIEIIKSRLNKNTALFIKGSRFLQLDKIVEELIAS